jgi:hypothetical protein
VRLLKRRSNRRLPSRNGDNYWHLLRREPDLIRNSTQKRRLCKGNH